ncbi:hypothetical protein, partial [Burkholderia cenocepacia]|uniref:hypothetical protein n=1 Tax=Burkholderia cenocepacia TaxID=95486 RepID=UPI0038CC011B
MIVAIVVVPHVAWTRASSLGWFSVVGCTYVAFLAISNALFARTGIVLEKDRLIVHGRIRTYALERDEIARFGGRPGGDDIWAWLVVPQPVQHTMSTIHVFRNDGMTVVLRDVLGGERACSRLAAVLNAWLQEPWSSGLPRRLEARAVSGARGLRGGARPPERGLGVGRRGRPPKARLTRAERVGAVAAVVGAVAGYVALAVAGTVAADPN